MHSKKFVQALPQRTAVNGKSKLRSFYYKHQHKMDRCGHSFNRAKHAGQERIGTRCKGKNTCVKTIQDKIGLILCLAAEQAIYAL